MQETHLTGVQVCSYAHSHTQSMHSYMRPSQIDSLLFYQLEVILQSCAFLRCLHHCSSFESFIFCVVRYILHICFFKTGLDMKTSAGCYLLSDAAHIHQLLLGLHVFKDWSIYYILCIWWKHVIFCLEMHHVCGMSLLYLGAVLQKQLPHLCSYSQAKRKTTNQVRLHALVKLIMPNVALY